MIQFQPQLYEKLVSILQGGEIPDAELEAKWITEDAETAEQALEIAERRARHEPLQYLLGAWEFYGMKMFVGSGVLIPRADTETMVDAICSRFPESAPLRIADLCTGSGCIALALKAHFPNAEVIGIDRSNAALAYAKRNAAYHHLPVQMIEADVCAAETPRQQGRFDLIVSNPPYLTANDMLHLQQEVQYEPAMALDGGEDGLDFYRSITKNWVPSLKQNGMLCFEIGIFQAEDVTGIMAENGLAELEQIADLNGITRVICGRKHPEMYLSME
ncbi:MAG: peptide chain release factor N(5)-glutamine methyltransferase [Oscillospiraceae bacterium]|nr:peptide chain release factor N(5)-glutamine methyltransferase [Oscillospiraceae bacterium]